MVVMMTVTVVLGLLGGRGFAVCVKGYGLNAVSRRSPS